MRKPLVCFALAMLLSSVSRSTKVGVEMRQEYALDLECVPGGESDILIRVSLRVNHCRHSCLFVSNNVGSVRQARQIELLEDHLTPSMLGDCYFGWATMRM
jgi:hypothetical protein